MHREIQKDVPKTTLMPKTHDTSEPIKAGDNAEVSKFSGLGAVQARAAVPYTAAVLNGSSAKSASMRTLARVSACQRPMTMIHTGRELVL